MNADTDFFQRNLLLHPQPFSSIYRTNVLHTPRSPSSLSKITARRRSSVSWITFCCSLLA
jgi:hypothetical protein